MPNPDEAIPEEPTLVSPGLLGTWIAQDNMRPAFDRANQLIKMCGLTPDAVFLGDSLTADWAVEAALCDLFPLALNRGIGGDCAKWLGARLEADALQFKPRNIALMIGTNDVAYRFGYDTDDTIVGNYQRDMGAVLERLAASGARCFVGTIPPQRRTQIEDPLYERKAACIPRMNDFLRRRVSAHGLTLVDYYSRFFDPDGSIRSELYTDAVHHNARGQWLLTQILREAVQSATIA